MEKLFIAPLNPFHFNGDLPDWYWFNHATDKCYYQKFEQKDTTTIQILSEIEAFSIRLRSFENNSIVGNVAVNALATQLVGQPFKVYEGKINFTGLDGYFYLEISWTDGTDKELYSEPFHVAESHEGTMLFDYKNSTNEFSVIFGANTSFQIRVEGTIQNFTPLSTDETYKNQKDNTTMLYSNPSQQWTLFVGDASGIPDWMSDKINRVMSCDTVKIDGANFNKAEGATWEVTRELDYPFSGLQLEIVQNDNLFSKSLLVVDEGEGEGEGEGQPVLLRKNKMFLNKSANFIVPEIIKNRCLLDYVAIQRTGFAAAQFSIGTTEGGSEVGIFDIDTGETSQTFTIRKLFSNTTNLYVTAAAGVVDYHFVYEQLDELGGGGDSTGVPAETSSLPINSVIPFNTSTYTVNTFFDVSTGLGRASKDLQDWAICDGRNGTPDLRDVYIKGLDPDLDGQLASAASSEHSKKIGINQMPSHEHLLDRKSYISSKIPKSQDGDNKAILSGGNTVFQSKTLKTGEGDSFNVEPKHRLLLYIQKIQ